MEHKGRLQNVVYCGSVVSDVGVGILVAEILQDKGDNQRKSDQLMKAGAENKYLMLYVDMCH